MVTVQSHTLIKLSSKKKKFQFLSTHCLRQIPPFQWMGPGCPIDHFKMTPLSLL